MAKRRNRNKRASGTGQPKTRSATGSQPKLASGSQPLKIARAGEQRMQLPKMADVVALPDFTELEEAFFAAGDTMAERVAQKIAAEQPFEEHAVERPSLWRRLFSRSTATA